MIEVEVPPARGAADEGRTGEGAQARDGAETEGSRDAHASAPVRAGLKPARYISNPPPTILCQSTPHLQLGPDVAYDLIGELGRACRTAEVGGLHAVEDGLEGRLVDSARHPTRVLFVEEREEGGSCQDHCHRVGYVLALQRRSRAVRSLRHDRLGILLLVERDQERLGPRYGAEHLHHEVRDAVAIPVEGGDNEGLAVSGQEQRVGGVYELGVVADVAAVLRSTVHLLLEHPLVDGGDGVLGAAEDLGPHLARLDKGKLRYTAAYPARDLLGPVGDLVQPLALAPLLRPVSVIDGHTDHRDRGVYTARRIDTRNTPPRTHDNGPVYPRSQDRIGRAHIARFLRRNGRCLDTESSLFHRRSRLVHDLIVRGPSVLQRQVVAHEIQFEPGHRWIEHP